MKNNKKRKFWIPAAICVTAFLIALSMLAPKNIAGVFASEQGEITTVEPLQTQTDGDVPADDPAEEPIENPDGDPVQDPAQDPTEVPTDAPAENPDGEPADNPDGDPADNSNEGEMPEDIANYPVATLTVSSSVINIYLGESIQTAYCKFGSDGEIGELTAGSDIAVEDPKMVIYSKEPVIEFGLYNGNVSAVDVSKMTELDNLFICNTDLAGIDLSKNVNITTLELSGNQIKSLNLSKNTKLHYLDVTDNQLTSLDLSKNKNIDMLFLDGNKFKTFNDVKLGSTEFSDCHGDYTIPNMPEKIKAGEKLDLSALNKCGTKKSYYEVSCDSCNVIPESDKDMVFVFGNAYAGKTITFYVENEGSILHFFGEVLIEENPKAPAAPEKATGDVPVDDISGTIKEANAAKKFEAFAVNEEDGKYVLGEGIDKKDLTLSINKVSASESFYNRIAKYDDKSFSKDKSRLEIYDITLTHEGASRIKLNGSISITLSYPSDMAKDWDKYDFKAYHFADFNYKTLTLNDPEVIESVPVSCDKKGIHITASGFSKYAISITPKKAPAAAPATGESNVATNVAILLALLAIAGIVAVFAKFRGEKKAELL